MKNRHRYPPNWPQMARNCKEQAQWQCQHCGDIHGTERMSKRTGEPYRMALQAAHLDHDPENPDPRLAALCPSCHGRLDWAYHQVRREVDIERMKHRMLLKRRRS